MPATLVPAVRTTYNQQDMIKALTEAWFHQFGTVPKKQSIGVLFAQNAHETGGTKSMWCNNIGNVKFIASKNPDDDNDKQYTMLSNVWEIINGKKTYFQPPHPATWFRAYKTLADGLYEHLYYLKNKRYKKAWVAVEAGNYVQFATILKNNLYYTDSIENYSKGMKIWFDKFMKDSTFEQTVQELQKPKVKEPNFFDKMKEVFPDSEKGIKVP